MFTKEQNSECHAHLVLKIKPAGGVDVVSVGEEGLLQGLGVGRPASLHVGQHRLEVLPVVTV